MKNFRFNDNILELRPPWSSGQDVALSRLSQGFDSPWGYHCRPTDGFLFRLGISPCDAIDAMRNNRISKPFYGVATKQPQLLLSYKHHVKYSVASLLTIPLGGTTAVLSGGFFRIKFLFWDLWKTQYDNMFNLVEPRKIRFSFFFSSYFIRQYTSLFDKFFC